MPAWAEFCSILLDVLFKALALSGSKISGRLAREATFEHASLQMSTIA